MNFLAHCLLSGDSVEIMVGNFIADSVRGNKWQNYPSEICAGIRLHRLIDQFTDTSAVVKQSKARLYEDYGKFAGIIVDVFYDYILTQEWSKYSKHELQDFTKFVYRTIHDHQQYLPDDVLNYLPYMVKQDWLYNYREIAGIERSLKGLSRRAKNVVQMEKSIQNLVEDYPLYLAEFNAFFPELVKFVAETIDQDTFRKQC